MAQRNGSRRRLEHVQDDICRTTFYAPIADDHGEGSVPECRFGSAHTNGFHAAFCDGAVRLVDYGVDLEVHRRLGHRSDGKGVDVSQLP
jgi:prepilin-type processing-associated H-X9-DG protein